MKSNEARIMTAFGLEQTGSGSGSGSEDFSIGQAVSFVNQVLRLWGFSKLVRGKRKREGVRGQRVEASDFI